MTGRPSDGIDEHDRAALDDAYANAPYIAGAEEFADTVAGRIVDVAPISPLADRDSRLVELVTPDWRLS